MDIRKLSRGVGITATLAAVLMAPTSSWAAVKAQPTATTINIGYFANLTHAPALIAREQRLFEKYLGAGVTVKYTLFTVGTAEIEALKAGAIDVGYVGPAPAISGYLTTGGTGLNIVSGATSGGAKFIVKPSLIATPGKPTPAEIAALTGKNIADPGLAGTQDVALKKYLNNNKLWANGAPTVNVVPLANADTLTQFKLGNIDGAWVPEPWATRLIQEGSGRVFVDEASLWPGGSFPTTEVIARQPFLKQYPGSVKAVLQANLEAIAYLSKASNQTNAIKQVQSQLLKGTGKALADSVIQSAWPALKFSADPVAPGIRQNFLAASKFNLLPSGSSYSQIKGILNLSLVNQLRAASHKKPFTVPTSLKK